MNLPELTVCYDGSCPLYRRLCGAERLQHVVRRWWPDTEASA